MGHLTKTNKGTETVTILPPTRYHHFRLSLNKCCNQINFVTKVWTLFKKKNLISGPLGKIYLVSLPLEGGLHLAPPPILDYYNTLPHCLSKYICKKLDLHKPNDYTLNLFLWLNWRLKKKKKKKNIRSYHILCIELGVTTGIVITFGNQLILWILWYSFYDFSKKELTFYETITLTIQLMPFLSC